MLDHHSSSISDFVLKQIGSHSKVFKLTIIAVPDFSKDGIVTRRVICPLESEKKYKYIQVISPIHKYNTIHSTHSQKFQFENSRCFGQQNICVDTFR